MDPDREAEYSRQQIRAVRLARSVWRQVAQYCGRSVDLTDLEQASLFALFLAAQRWDSSRGANLWTFAERSVRRAVLDVCLGARSGQRLPYCLAEDEEATLPTVDEEIDARRTASARRAVRRAVLDVCLGVRSEADEPLRSTEPGRSWTAGELAQAAHVSRRYITKLLKQCVIEGELVEAAGRQTWRIPDRAAADFLARRAIAA